jgi:hypothetical protein
MPQTGSPAGQAVLGAGVPGGGALGDHHRADVGPQLFVEAALELEGSGALGRPVRKLQRIG